MGRFSSSVNESRQRMFDEVEEEIRDCIENGRNYFYTKITSMSDAKYLEEAIAQYDGELREDGLALVVVEPMDYSHYKSGGWDVPDSGIYFNIRIVSASEAPTRPYPEAASRRPSGSSGGGLQ